MKPRNLFCRPQINDQKSTITNPPRPSRRHPCLQKVTDPKNLNKTSPFDAAQLLDHVSQFLARYLECTEQQRSVLARGSSTPFAFIRMNSGLNRAWEAPLTTFLLHLSPKLRYAAV